MLDECSAALLAAVNDACVGGGFIILEERELLRAFPGGEGDVGKTLAYLADKKLIELRYAEDGTYCVRTMPAGRSYAERTEREKREREKSRRDLLLWSFCGSFLGGALVALIGTLLGVLLHV